MKTTQTIFITNPSKALVAFMEKAQQRKKEQMRLMREAFLQQKQ